jgi:hypothetical protein
MLIYVSTENTTCSEMQTKERFLRFRRRKLHRLCRAAGLETSHVTLLRAQTSNLNQNSKIKGLSAIANRPFSFKT